VGLLALHLDRDLATHLAEAVQRHRVVLHHLGNACPPELTELEALLVEVSKGPERSRAVNGTGAANVGAVKSEWLTTDECAVITAMSRATIRRRIADGSLRSAKVGRSRRVSEKDLEQFMDGRAR
jgi:excisionase family DNA binding protein